MENIRISPCVRWHPSLFNSEWWRKGGVLAKRRTCPRESRAGPGQNRGDKRRGQERFLWWVFPPRAEEEERGCSPDRSEDVLFCFSSALPLPAGSNIMLGTKASAICGCSCLLMCAVYRFDDARMERHTDVQSLMWWTQNPKLDCKWTGWIQGFGRMYFHFFITTATLWRLRGY